MQLGGRPLNRQTLVKSPTEENAQKYVINESVQSCFIFFLNPDYFWRYTCSKLKINIYFSGGQQNLHQSRTRGHTRAPHYRTALERRTRTALEPHQSAALEPRTIEPHQRSHQNRTRAPHYRTALQRRRTIKPHTILKIQFKLTFVGLQHKTSGLSLEVFGHIFPAEEQTSSLQRICCPSRLAGC